MAAALRFAGQELSGLEGVARDMIRISTVFIAICMVLVAASLGLILYSVLGISGSEFVIVALTALTFLILYNAVSMRLRDRTDVGGQIADLSRGTADLARQVAEFGRRLAAVEGRVVSANSTLADRIQTVIGEINELGVLVKQLASSVASHDDMLAAGAAAPPQPVIPPQREAPVELPDVAEETASAPAPARAAPVAAAPVAAAPAIAEAAPSRSHAHVPNAVEGRGRGKPYRHLSAADGHSAATQGALLRGGDTAARRQGRGSRRRGFHRDRGSRRTDWADRSHGDVALRAGAASPDGAQQGRLESFRNVAAGTLGNPTTFSAMLDFLEANRALAVALCAQFKQSTFRNLGPTETEHLAALAQRGYRFSIDHVTDLRIEPRELADRGVRFIKVPAALLLDQRSGSTSDIHPSDLFDLLGRFGIDLIAERIEGERAVVDLLDYDVRFGQDFCLHHPGRCGPRGHLLPAGRVE